MPLRKSSVVGAITFDKRMFKGMITENPEKPGDFIVDLPELRVVKDYIADKVSILFGVKIRKTVWGIQSIGN